MIVQKNMKKCYPSLRRVCLAVSRQLGPSNSGQESSAAAVLACAIMPSEVQKNMKKCYPAHPSNVSASRCRGSLLCPSNSRQKGRNTQPPFNPSVGSLCHFCATATRFSYRFPIFETSAPSLCGTTGMFYLIRYNMFEYVLIRDNLCKICFNAWVILAGDWEWFQST